MQIQPPVSNDPLGASEWLHYRDVPLFRDAIVCSRLATCLTQCLEDKLVTSRIQLKLSTILHCSNVVTSYSNIMKCTISYKYLIVFTISSISYVNFAKSSCL